MNFISFLVFIPLQVFFLPLAVVGMALVGYKQMVVSKRLGSSQTAIEVLNGRWTMHVFGIREDTAAQRLANAVPNTSTLGLWFVLFPLWVKHKISSRYFGYPRVAVEGEENIADLMIARTLYIDQIIDRLADDVEQFVVLGAGYDTRAYGALKDRGLTFFELDQLSTQQGKRKSLSDADIDSSHVRFVSVDFSADDFIDKLQQSGCDLSKKTLFLWEGVTLYLSESDVRKTLYNISTHAAVGSAIVADFYAERFIQLGSSKAGKKTLAYTDEELGFGLPFETSFENTLEEFISSENLKLGKTHFMGRSAKNGPFVVVSELEV